MIQIEGRDKKSKVRSIIASGFSSHEAAEKYIIIAKLKSRYNAIKIIGDVEGSQVQKAY